jgi:hypothetical protein
MSRMSFLLILSRLLDCVQLRNWRWGEYRGKSRILLRGFAGSEWGQNGVGN